MNRVEGTRVRDLILRGAVLLVALGIMVLTADLGHLSASLHRIEPVYLLLILILFFARMPVGALRWKILLQDMGVALPLAELQRISLASQFFGMLLPSANGSDIARGLMMKTPERQWSIIAISILTDRLYGVAALFFLTLPATLYMIAHGVSHPVVFLLAGISAAAILTGIAFLIWIGSHSSVAASTEQPATIWTRIGGAGPALLCTFRRPFAVASCLLLSLVAQILSVASTWLTGVSMGFEIELAVYFAYVPVIWLITLLPISFLGIGVREASFAALFATLGIPATTGIAIGLLNSAIAIAVSLLSGLAILLPARKPPPMANNQESPRA